MDHDRKNTVEVDVTARVESKNKWVKKHAQNLQQIYKQWQQPLGIDSQDYLTHLEQELAEYWEDPLLKSLMESI